MTLTQRLTALATALGQALRERGLPTGGSAGDVLIRQPGATLSTTWGPVQVTSVGDLNNLTTTAKSNVVSAINEVRGDLNALSVSEMRATDYSGADYLTSDRPANLAGRAMSGPIIDALDNSYRFSTITVPLRNVQAGDVLRLIIQEVPPLGSYTTNTAPIRYLRDVNLTPGQVQADLNGPFDVPSGKSYAIMVGIVGANMSTGAGAKNDRFYGDVGSYPNFAGRSVRAASRTTCDMTDAIDNPASGGRRIILMTGRAGTKTLVGPIDTRDFPMVGSITGLAAGEAGLIVDSNGERLAMRRLDGVVRYGTYLNSTYETVGIQAQMHTKRQVASASGSAAEGAAVWDWAFAGNGTRSATAGVAVVPTGGAVNATIIAGNGETVPGMGGRGQMLLERVTRVGGVTGRILIRFYQYTYQSDPDWTRAYGAVYTGGDADRPLGEFVLEAGINEAYPARMIAAHTNSNNRIVATAQALDDTNATSTVTIGFRLMG